MSGGQNYKANRNPAIYGGSIKLRVSRCGHHFPAITLRSPLFTFSPSTG